LRDVAVGDGPVGAAFKALEKLTGIEFILESYHINAVTEGVDALGMADVRLKVTINLTMADARAQTL
jgi:2-isopropylmalate synthase